MRHLALSVLAIALASASPAAAAAPAPAPAAPEKKVCKKPDTPVSSRLGPKRICATKKEWEGSVPPAERDTRGNVALPQGRGLQAN